MPLRPTAAATRGASPAATWRRRASARASSLCVAGLCGTVQALPQNPVPVFGIAEVQTLSSREMRIVQGTDRAGLDWTSFSLGTGETLNIQQPGSSSVLFNRVLGPDPSKLYGQISANGRVFLSNPRGVVFGTGGQVDVAALVATTLDWGDVSFGTVSTVNTTSTSVGPSQTGPQTGTSRLTLQSVVSTNGGPGAVVQQSGHRIQAGGTVVLAGTTVEQGGEIVAPRIGLAAAERVSVDLDGDGLVFFELGTDQLDTQLRQLGRLQADGGLVDLRAQARAGFTGSVLNLDGVVQARSLSLRQGRILVDGGSTGLTQVQGQVSATGTAGSDERGGTLQVTGAEVRLAGTAVLDVQGQTGGGTLWVGQSDAGIEPGVTQQARSVRVADGARLQADATGAGPGGRIVVGSGGLTQVDGVLSARGGPLGTSSGGTAEITAQTGLGFGGRADLGTDAGGPLGELRLAAPTLRLAASEDAAGTPTVRLQALKDTMGLAQVTAQATQGDLELSGQVTGLSRPGMLRLEAAKRLAFGSATRLGDAATDQFELELSAGTDLTSGASTRPDDLSFIGTAGAVNIRTGGQSELPAISAGHLNVAAGLGIDFRGPVLTTQGITLAASGQVRQDAGAELRTSQLHLGGSGDYLLTHPHNRAEQLEAGAGAGAGVLGLHYVNEGSLHLGRVASQFDAWIRTQASTDTRLSAQQREGQLWLGSGVTVGRTLGLWADGAIGQDGSAGIDASALGVHSRLGDIWLGSGSNRVGLFTGVAEQGRLNFGSSQGHVLGEVGPSVGRIRGADGVPGEAVFAGQQGLQAPQGEVTLRAVSGQVGQQEGASIQTRQLLLQGQASFHLTGAGNQVGQLVAVEGGGSLAYANAGSLTLGPLERRGTDGTTGDVVVRSLAGGLTLEGAIDAGQVALDAAGSVIQGEHSGAITATALGVRSSNGDIRLASQAGNQVQTWAAHAEQGQVLFRAAGGYLIQAMDASPWPVASVGSLASPQALFRGTEGHGVYAAGLVQLDTREAATAVPPVSAATAHVAPLAVTRPQGAGAGTDTVGQTAQGGIQAGALALTGRAAYALTQPGLNRVAAWATQAEGPGAGAVHLLLDSEVALRPLLGADGTTVLSGIQRQGAVRLESTGPILLQGAVQVDSGGHTVQLISHFDAPVLAGTAAQLGTERAYLRLQGADLPPDATPALRGEAIGQQALAAGPGAGHSLSLGDGTALQLLSTRNASIRVDSSDNLLGRGTVSARSGDFRSLDTARLDPADAGAALSRITLAGEAIRIGDSGARVQVPGYAGDRTETVNVGLEADLVRLAAPVVTTQGSTTGAAPPYIVARHAPGLADTPAGQRLPSLVLAIPPQAAATAGHDLGATSQPGLNDPQQGQTQGLRVLLGHQPATGTSAGWLLVTPDPDLPDLAGGQAANAEQLDALRRLGVEVYLSGPVQAAGSLLRLPGQQASASGGVPVAVSYNLTPVRVDAPPAPDTTPPLGPVAAALAQLHSAFATGFIEPGQTGSRLAAVLAQGVMPELTAAPLASEGHAEAAQPREACDPAPGKALSCADQVRSESVDRDLRDKALVDVGKAGAATGKAEVRAADACDAAAGQLTGCEAPKGPPPTPPKPPARSPDRP